MRNRYYFRLSIAGSEHGASYGIQKKELYASRNIDLRPSTGDRRPASTPTHRKFTTSGAHNLFLSSIAIGMNAAGFWRQRILRSSFVVGYRY